jgi:hypothetical protein
MQSRFCGRHHNCRRQNDSPITFDFSEVPLRHGQGTEADSTTCIHLQQSLCGFHCGPSLLVLSAPLAHWWISHSQGSDPTVPQWRYHTGALRHRLKCFQSSAGHAIHMVPRSTTDSQRWLPMMLPPPLPALGRWRSLRSGSGLPSNNLGCPIVAVMPRNAHEQNTRPGRERIGPGPRVHAGQDSAAIRSSVPVTCPSGRVVTGIHGDSRGSCRIDPGQSYRRWRACAGSDFPS